MIKNVGLISCNHIFLHFQVRRFERKRKPPTPRRKILKISKKDHQSAAEGLLELGNEIPEPDSPRSCVAQNVEVRII